MINYHASNNFLVIVYKIRPYPYETNGLYNNSVYVNYDDRYTYLIAKDAFRGQTLL